MTVQHAQIPQILTKKKLPKEKDEDPEPELMPGDKVIYGAIRLHMDETRTCYPSIATIKRIAHCGQKHVEDATQRFIKSGLIKISKKKLENGKWTNLYIFPKTEFDNQFDMFTKEFLTMNLPLLLKEYIMDLQTSMYEKDTGIGKVSHADVTIQEKTGWSLKEIKKFDNLLIEMDALSKIPSGKVDQAGFPIMIREFNLDVLHQAKLWIKAVNEQLVATQNQIEEVDDKVDNLVSVNAAQYKEMQKEITRLNNRMERYEKALVANGINPNTIQKEFEM